MCQSVKVSNVFNTLTLKQVFWKTKTFFKKLKYGILVKTTKIENTSFSFKTDLSEANVKTNRTATRSITKSGVFLVTTLFFGKFVLVLEPLKKSQFGVPTTQIPIFVFFLSSGVQFYSAFSLWISLRYINNVCPIFHSLRGDAKSSLGVVNLNSTVYQIFKNSVLQNTYQWLLTYSNKQIFWFLVRKISRYLVAFLLISLVWKTKINQENQQDRPIHVGRPTQRDNRIW